MAKDDIFRIIYVILKELYENKKEGIRTPRDHISAERFDIPDSYWLDIICELIKNDYVSGVKITNTKTGRIIGGLDDIDITLKGIEYLQENSMMKKVCDFLKGVKDIAPGL